MAVPKQLLEQLLSLGKDVRLELAHTLLDSVETDAELDQGDDGAERAQLDAVLKRAIEQCKRGEAVPAEEVFRELRVKRAARAAR